MVGWNDIPKEYKPDWTTWKVKGTPFEESQRRLAKLGLSDPWARNEVWLDVAKKKANMSVSKLILRGWKGGLGIFLAVILVEPFIWPKIESDSHHH